MLAQETPRTSTRMRALQPSPTPSDLEPGWNLRTGALSRRGQEQLHGAGLGIIRRSPFQQGDLKKKKKIRSLEDSRRLTALNVMRDSGHESLGCAARIKQMRVNKRLLEKSVMGWKSGGLSAIPSLF